jgi:hypothetical protein
MNRIKPLFGLFLMLFIRKGPGYAQNALLLPAKDLYKKEFILDGRMFNAYNERNIDRFKKMFATGLEFFHDEGGLASYVQTVNFLLKHTEGISDLKRELIKESPVVFPMPGYGAIVMRRHRFTHTETGKQEAAIFNFVNIWQQKDSNRRV